MRLRTAAVAAAIAASVPSMTVPAEAWGGDGHSYYPDCGYGYRNYGHILLYSYGCGCPPCGEHRNASNHYVRRHIHTAVPEWAEVLFVARAFQNSDKAVSLPFDLFGQTRESDATVTPQNMFSPSISTER